MTRLFDLVVPGVVASFAASPSEAYLVDLATAGADVIVTLPASALDGQVIGVQVANSDLVHRVTWAGSVEEALPMSGLGDSCLLTWSSTGAAWYLVSQVCEPGLVGGEFGALGAFRLPALTDYSGAGNALTGINTNIASVALKPGRLSMAGTNWRARSTTAAPFKLAGAMSLVALAYVAPTTTSNTCLASVGSGAGASATNNLWWWFGLQNSASVRLSYKHQNGVNVNVSYAPSSELSAGWHVLGFTRSASLVVSVYVDGTLVGTSGALTAMSDGSAAELTIGAMGRVAAGYSESYPSQIDQVAIYGAELTGPEMLVLAKTLMGR